MQKWLSIASNHWKVILLHVNARPPCCYNHETKLIELEWFPRIQRIFALQYCVPDLVSSDYHLFRLMQHALDDIHCRIITAKSKIDCWINWLKRQTFFQNSSICQKSGKKSYLPKINTLIWGIQTFYYWNKCSKDTKKWLSTPVQEIFIQYSEYFIHVCIFDVSFTVPEYLL